MSNSDIVERLLKTSKLIAEGKEFLVKAKELQGSGETTDLTETIESAIHLFKTLMSVLYRTGTDAERVRISVSVLPLDPLFRQHLIMRGITNLQTLWMIEKEEEVTALATATSTPSKYPFDSERNRDALALVGITLR